MTMMVGLLATLLLATVVGAVVLRYRFTQPDGCDRVLGWEVHIAGGACGLPDAVVAVLPTHVCGVGDCGVGMQRDVPLALPPGAYATYLIGLLDHGKTEPSNMLFFTVP